MNLIVKIGLSILAGAAVMFGINCAEKKSTVVNDNASSSSLEDGGVSVTSSPEEKIQKEQRGNSGFMESAKKTQVTIEIVSKIVTCLYRVILCVNEIFVPNNQYRGYQGNYQGTIII